MDNKTFNTYIAKFEKLVESCIFVQYIFYDSLESNNSELNLFWQQGAFDGVLVYFLRTLKDNEKYINNLVFQEIACNVVDKSAPIDVFDYIESALIVLDRFGFHIPVPDED